MKKDLVFVHVPKNAGSSIVETLRGRGVPARKVHWDSMDKRHVRRKRRKEGLMFAVCRNPYERAQSCYRFFRNKRMKVKYAKDVQTELLIKAYSDWGRFWEHCDLKRFTATATHWKPQCHWIRENVDVVLRFETLQDDWDELMLSCGYEPCKVMHKNASKAPPEPMELTQNVIQKINEIYHDDFVRFGYEKL